MKDYKLLYKEAIKENKKLDSTIRELRTVNNELNLMHHNAIVKLIGLRNEIKNKNKTSKKSVGKESSPRSKNQKGNQD
tara:strand:+ start:178 stop:411 length:234 start_codon:yes stop_codon:yes gene_type:complete